jgi:hypothetical protein
MKAQLQALPAMGDTALGAGLLAGLPSRREAAGGSTDPVPARVLVGP